MAEVTLTRGEWDAACTIGRKRQWLREKHGRSPAEYRDGGGSHMDRNAIGAVAEYALARHYGKDVLRDWCENKSYACTAEAIKAIPCDVGKNLHVRASSNPKARMLIVHEAPGRAEEPVARRRFRPTDKPGGVFILAHVLEESLSVVFLGWRKSDWVQANCAWNTTDPGFFHTDRHAYTCDKDDLLPLSEIPSGEIWCEK